MRKSVHVAAPLLALAAASMLSGCRKEPIIPRGHQATVMGFESVQSPKGDTQRGGFGSTFEDVLPFLVGGAIGAVLIFGRGE